MGSQIIYRNKVFSKVYEKTEEIIMMTIMIIFFKKC